ncbi:MAG: AAA family ATPase [Afipia sp.]
MLLKLNSALLSIKSFPDVEIPNFTLVTGVNGTGKSHLLKSINEGRITTDITSNPHNETRLYDWTNLIPQDAPVYDSRTWTSERINLYQQFQGLIRQLGGEIIDAARKQGLPATLLSDPTRLANLTLIDLVRILGSNEKASAMYLAIGASVQTVSNRIRQHLNNVQYQTALDAITKFAGKSVAGLSREDFFANHLRDRAKVDMFQQSFAELFVDYRDLALSNDLKAYQTLQTGIASDALTKEQFIEKHMIPPWSFVNESIYAAGLDFEVDHPDLSSFNPYQPTLRKRSTGDQIFFSDLSSGEKVLMSFAICLYYTQDTRQLSNYPKLLLLDEIDAPLHPSMSKTILKVIQETIVQKHNVHVIATTHSPSTVALAPENSLHVIERSTPGLQKITKTQALNILTDGVPTIAISYEGRRQVFVESPNDAKLYDSLYQNLKSYNRSERSLQFIATGPVKNSDETHTNTGCEIVKHLVDTLAKSGNNSVFGLVDWDGQNTPTERLAVLAHEKRDGLENVILDPLLLATLIVGFDRGSIGMIGLTENINYPSFLKFSAQDLQPVIDSVQACVLGEKQHRVTSCAYLGGFSLNLRTEYLSMDDHKLESAVMLAFPSFRAISKGRSGALTQYIVDTVIRDQPEYAPAECLEVFETLLNKPAH